MAGEASFDVYGRGVADVDAAGARQLPREPAQRRRDRFGTVNLTTAEGPLRLTGQGQWTDSGFRFRGEGRADTGQEEALSNLLNIIGRRQGALSVIAIG